MPVLHDKVRACSTAKRHDCFKALLHKRSLVAMAKGIKRNIEAAESMVLKDELRHRMRVLRRLGYLDPSGMVTKKGHVRAPA
jgi:superfamily II RNA helicase